MKAYDNLSQEAKEAYVKLSQLGTVEIRYSQYTDCFYAAVPSAETLDGIFLRSPSKHCATKDAAVIEAFNAYSKARVVVGAASPNRREYEYDGAVFREVSQWA